MTATEIILDKLQDSRNHMRRSVTGPEPKKEYHIRMSISCLKTALKFERKLLNQLTEDGPKDTDPPSGQPSRAEELARAQNLAADANAHDGHPGLSRAVLILIDLLEDEAPPEMGASGYSHFYVKDSVKVARDLLDQVDSVEADRTALGAVRQLSYAISELNQAVKALYSHEGSSYTQ